MGTQPGIQPDAILHRLRDQVPPLRKFKQKHQAQYAHMLWAFGVGSQHQHSEVPGAFFTPARGLDRDFGRGGFVAINDACGIFDCDPTYNRHTGVTRAYTPTHIGQAAVDYCVEAQRAPTGLISATGRAVRKLGSAIWSLDADGLPAKASMPELRSSVPVNVDNIHRKLMDWKRARCREDDPNRDQWLHRRIDGLSRIQFLQWNSVLEFGHIPLQYAETQAGRLQGVGLHLQNLPREVRNAALAGSWDYDIENCHFAIALQLFARHDYRADSIEHYLANKQAVREDLAAEVGITIKQAKTVLLMALYGAQRAVHIPPKNIRKKPPAIPGEIGSEAAQRLYDTDTFKDLHADVSDGRKAVLLATSPYRGKVWNCLGKGIADTCRPEQKLGHLMQAIEAQMLHVIGREHGADLLLLIHDGWVSERPMCTRTVERQIEAATGYSVEVSEEQIAPVSDGAEIISIKKVCPVKSAANH
jgi:hypothetical protein